MKDIFELYKEAYGEEALDALVKEAASEMEKEALFFDDEQKKKIDAVNAEAYKMKANGASKEQIEAFYNKGVHEIDPNFYKKVLTPAFGAYMGTVGGLTSALVAAGKGGPILPSAAAGAGLATAAGGLGGLLGGTRADRKAKKLYEAANKEAFQEDFDMYKQAFGQEALNDLINEVSGDMKKQASEAIQKEALWFQSPEQKQKMMQILDYTGDLQYDFEDKQYNEKEQFDALQRLQQDSFYKELDDISDRGMHEADPNHNKKTYSEVGTIGGGLAGLGVGTALAEKGWKPKAIGGARGALIGANAGALLGLGKGIVEDIREKRKYSVKEAAEAMELFKQAFGEEALDTLVREAAEEMSTSTENEINQSDTESNDGTTYNANSETGAFIDKMRKTVK